MKQHRFLVPLLVLGWLALAGCKSQTSPITQAPIPVPSPPGHLTVADFRYLPALATGSRIRPNQIRNTAYGNILLDQPIDKIFLMALLKELPFVGAKLEGPDRQLGGEVEELMIDDLGYSGDWTLRVKYVLKEKATGRVLYESVKSTKRRANKFASQLVALNETIKLNVEELVQDKALLALIK